MDISIDDSTSPSLVALTGRFDHVGANAISARLCACAATRDAVVIDMTHVTFISSMGIRQLISAASILRRRGGHLTLRQPTPAVMAVIHAAGVADLLPTAPAVAD